MELYKYYEYQVVQDNENTENLTIRYYNKRKPNTYNTKPQNTQNS